MYLQQKCYLYLKWDCIYSLSFYNILQIVIKYFVIISEMARTLLIYLSNLQIPGNQKFKKLYQENIR